MHVESKILKCSNSDDFQKTIDKHFETIIDQGLQPMKCQFEKKGEVVTYLLKNAIYYRHHAEISQFVKGLNSVGFLYDEMLREPQAFLSFFTDQDSKTLDFDSFRRLYKVNFSAEGSNNRIQEKDTIYCFETFLMDCTEAESKVTLQDVLLFWTGANSVPPLGFDKSFEINFVTAADKRLPVAHTCGMILELGTRLNIAYLFVEFSVYVIGIIKDLLFVNY
ncbi:hypothetical protein KUTeg_007252 [Tegillarca granosa]|uniref:HECT domain-containing protein n=1 Tax=Tegillarca granosa TaxID=220873 RepID=A0ABQ9FGV5_TEGGR|nr:hypothetical protein KUTeg_007252 [Tegillarca granosa]